MFEPINRGPWYSAGIVRNDDDGQITAMEFRLTYAGPLKADTRRNPRPKLKHEIRKYFHPQLRRLWREHPFLQDKCVDDHRAKRTLWVDDRAERFRIGDYSFVPLLTSEMHATCRIHVLFLRPDSPGNVIKSGDIDNRLKTLFDSFQVPTETGQFGGYNEPNSDEKPFYCLLEDDSLVTSVSIETDMLLEPVNGDFDKNVARLFIGVTIVPYIATWGNIGL